MKRDGIIEERGKGYILIGNLEYVSFKDTKYAPCSIDLSIFLNNSLSLDAGERRAYSM